MTGHKQIKAIVLEAATGCSTKKVFLKISQNSWENTCVAFSFFIKRIRNRCFSMNFAKVLRTPFLHYTSGGCFCYFSIKMIAKSKKKWNL